MKIYEHKPVYVIGIQIEQVLGERYNISLCETTVKEVLEVVTNLMESQKVSPITKGKATRISIRERIGKINGKGCMLSVKGFTPKQVHDLILEEITVATQA